VRAITVENIHYKTPQSADRSTRPAGPRIQISTTNISLRHAARFACRPVRSTVSAPRTHAHWSCNLHQLALHRPCPVHREGKGRLPLPAAGRSTPPRRMHAALPPLLHAAYVGFSRARHACSPRHVRARRTPLSVSLRRHGGFSLDGFSVLWSDGLGTQQEHTRHRLRRMRCSNGQPPGRTDRWSTACQGDHHASTPALLPHSLGVMCSDTLTILR
jgi:hypothetical protein